MEFRFRGGSGRILLTLSLDNHTVLEDSTYSSYRKYMFESHLHAPCINPVDQLH